jgi:hypothetical protein
VALTSAPRVARVWFPFPGCCPRSALGGLWPSAGGALLELIAAAQERIAFSTAAIRGGPGGAAGGCAQVGCGHLGADVGVMCFALVARG